MGDEMKQAETGMPSLTLEPELVMEQEKEPEVQAPVQLMEVTQEMNPVQQKMAQTVLTPEEQQMVEDFAQRIQSQGISFEQYMQFTGSTPEMLLEQVTPQAEERIKARLVLEAVVKAENIEVSDEEFEKELEEMAKQYNMELDQIKQFTTDADKETIKKDIAVQKAAKLVVDAAK